MPFDLETSQQTQIRMDNLISKLESLYFVQRMETISLDFGDLRRKLLNIPKRIKKSIEFHMAR